MKPALGPRLLAGDTSSNGFDSETTLIPLLFGAISGPKSTNKSMTLVILCPRENLFRFLMIFEKDKNDNLPEKLQVETLVVPKTRLFCCSLHVERKP